MDCDSELRERYLAEVGKEPVVLSCDHPDLWQWEYRGTRAEREELAEMLGLAQEPALIEGQESLL